MYLYVLLGDLTKWSKRRTGKEKKNRVNAFKKTSFFSFPVLRLWYSFLIPGDIILGRGQRSKRRTGKEKKKNRVNAFKKTFFFSFPVLRLWYSFLRLSGCITNFGWCCSHCFFFTSSNWHITPVLVYSNTINLGFFSIFSNFKLVHKPTLYLDFF